MNKTDHNRLDTSMDYCAPQCDVTVIYSEGVLCYSLEKPNEFDVEW